MTADTDGRWLRFIVDSIDKVEAYLPAGRDAFLSDPMCQDAVVWRLQAIADAAKNHLSDELKARHSSVPWRAVYGFRNIAAHQYADINIDLVWELASTHLSVLKRVAASELAT